MKVTNKIDACLSNNSDKAIDIQKELETNELAVTEIRKELAKVDSEIEALQVESPVVAAEAYVGGKSKVFSEHALKLDKVKLRRTLLDCAQIGLGRDVERLKGNLVTLERENSKLKQLSASLADTLAGVKEFQDILREIKSVESIPFRNRVVLREHEKSHALWNRVPDRIEKLGRQARELGLETEAREALAENGVQLKSTFEVIDKQAWRLPRHMF